MHRVLASALPFFLVGPLSAVAQDRAASPNVIIILSDDQGYGDLGCYGHPTLNTQHLDRLAAGGTRFTQFYVPSPVCSPTRAALLTGCYPKRVGMHRRVVFPPDAHGLHPDEVTLAEVLRAKGYATGCFGKWHLGHRPGMLPNDQGFDAFEGLPYSNDMAQSFRKPDSAYTYRLPWLKNGAVEEWEPDQTQLTRRYTDAAVAFIEEHKGEPFFLYMPHSAPHMPLKVDEATAGQSLRGLYGDVIEQVDRSVGRVVETLERLGLRQDTLIVFLSDNGPTQQYKLKGGSAGPLRGGKGSNWEGGQRVPCIVSWPGVVPAGRLSREVGTCMDLLPTVASLVAAELPAERKIDGHDVSALWRGEPGVQSATELFLYYGSDGKLAGVRQGPFKLLLDGPQLYHVERDLAEEYDLAEENTDRVAHLVALAYKADKALDQEARPAGSFSETLFDPQRPAK